MKRILLYGGKHGHMVWEASTSEQEDAALKALFSFLDKEWNVYNDLRMVESALYDKAKQGDQKSIKNLLLLRRNYEYEWFEILPVQEIQE